MATHAKKAKPVLPGQARALNGSPLRTVIGTRQGARDAHFHTEMQVRMMSSRRGARGGEVRRQADGMRSMVHKTAWFSLLSSVLLSACASSDGPLPLYQEERAKICHVRVETLPSALAVAKAGEGGVGEGLATGTALGLLLLPLYGPPALIITPVAGMSCGAARGKHPDGGVVFRKALETVSEDALGLALDGELTRRLAECRRVHPDPAGRERTDTVIQIKQVSMSWGCPGDRQEYFIAVNWRALVEGSNRLMGNGHTTCRFTSSRSVEEWSADLVWARREVELALAKTGERIALDILDVERPTECRHVLLRPAEDKTQQQ